MALSYIAPSSELAVELEEVRADATALADVFSQLNAPLPTDFPKSAVVELASALHKLPSGTARGCLRPLNEAQSQLATIRSQYIRHDHPEEGWEVDHPPLFRGEPVDQRLRNLMSSVSTALQTANRMAAEEPEADEPEFGIEPPEDQSTAALIERSANAQRELEAESAELDALQIKSEPADTLGRRLTDAVVLNQLGRGELRLPRVVSARLRRIAGTLRDYPALLQKAAELISAGTHLADYAHERWSRLEDRIFHAGTTTIREIADDISNFAKKLETNRKLADPTTAMPEFDVEEAAKMIHLGQSPPIHWRERITHLPLGNRRLKDLKPLAGLVNLREFRKPSVRINDISPLSGLLSLQLLNLDSTSVADLSPISGLTQLRSLSLDNSAVTDLSPLKALADLQYLSLMSTSVSDLSPLAGLAKLYRLNAMLSQVSDVGPLAGLKKLRFLDLDGTQVSDLSPLGSLSELVTLELRGVRGVSQLARLGGLANLKSLYLNGTEIRNIEPLESLITLVYLGLADTPVLELAPLANMQHLINLDIRRTLVDDITSISELPSLQSLNLSGTAVTDLSALNTPKLGSLDISGTEISDLTPLLRLQNLWYLSVSKKLEPRVPKELRNRLGRFHVVEDKA
ncbi:leucine-rich repeat domain-containing protein [Bradyrhizobium diazoefficiens]|uniref:leucine-rich repeat domain-containing protein n=1 Tax=Bradyrhizobium diazoefficiens TaxID=1355477 RepID=UPI001B76F0F1|nr:Leucine-rich repeat (LRR) protein [Bradyrhizobium japonicum]